MPGRIWLAFHQPIAVLDDLALLRRCRATNPSPEMAEVVKAGFIGDPPGRSSSKIRALRGPVRNAVPELISGRRKARRGGCR